MYIMGMGKEVKKSDLLRLWHDTNNIALQIRKAAIVIIALLAIGLCLHLLLSRRGTEEVFIPDVEPYKTKEECYEAAERRRIKCLETNPAWVCVDDIYCDVRGCC